MKQSILKDFTKYVALNILGMIGISCYILADTFFIAKALGATGIAALNLSISIYSIINGIGLMLGIGGAGEYSMFRAQKKNKKANLVFVTSVKSGVVLGCVFVMIGIFGTKPLALMLGADEDTLSMTIIYLKTMLCFAPFFILNNIALVFVRNDNNPRLSMIAMLAGSFLNIVLDYIFIFPLKGGMFGAAFATGLSAVISILILTTHGIKKKSRYNFIQERIEWEYVGDILILGFSAFITEVSSGIVLITFNLTILKLEGNIGVSSYGIVANIALVGIAIFTGVAQGMQPLISKSYGMKHFADIKKIVTYALLTSLMLSMMIYLSVYMNPETIVSIFNEQQNPQIASIAQKGLKIYFIGFFFAGINIIITMYLSIVERAKDAFIISVSRGCVVIIPIVLLLSKVMGMTGIWLSFVLAEFIVMVMAVVMICRDKVLKNIV